MASEVRVYIFETGLVEPLIEVNEPYEFVLLSAHLAAVARLEAERKAAGAAFLACEQDRIDYVMKLFVEIRVLRKQRDKYTNLFVKNELIRAELDAEVKQAVSEQK